MEIMYCKCEVTRLHITYHVIPLFLTLIHLKCLVPHLFVIRLFVHLFSFGSAFIIEKFQKILLQDYRSHSSYEAYFLFMGTGHTIQNVPYLFSFDLTTCIGVFSSQCTSSKGPFKRILLLIVRVTDKSRQAREQERREQYKQTCAVVKRDDGRLQAYGWSLPAKFSAQVITEAAAMKSPQLTIPIPIYCRPVMEDDATTKVLTAIPFIGSQW